MLVPVQQRFDAMNQGKNQLMRVDSPWIDAQKQDPNPADIRISVYRTKIRQKVTEFQNFNGSAVFFFSSSTKVYGTHSMAHSLWAIDYG